MSDTHAALRDLQELRSEFEEFKTEVDDRITSERGKMLMLIVFTLCLTVWLNG